MASIGSFDDLAAGRSRLMKESARGDEMRRNWSSRMMFSYFPIFLLTVSILIFLSFLIVGELSRSETKKANEISTGYIVDTVQRSLVEIELSVLQEMETNKVYDDFLSGFNQAEDSSRLYDTVQEMKGMLDRNNLIDSIYLYRALDEKVLTSSGLKALDLFADRKFLEQALLDHKSSSWSAVRPFQQKNADASIRVISMYKLLPIPFGAEGIVVVNINMHGIERMIDDMTNNQISFMRIVNEKGGLVYAAHGEQELNSDVLTRIRSENTGWVFESGIRAGQLFAWVSVVSYIWIIVGIITVLLGTIYIIYITRKNYRPIQVMMNRIQALQIQGGNVAANSELVVIDHALEKLIEQTMHYEQQHHENLLVQRRQLFLDLLEGERLASLADRLLQLEAMPIEPGKLVFIAAEINQYGDFRKNYSLKDQNMLKFTLMNLFQEFTEEDMMHSWSEWISGSRMGVIIAWDHTSSVNKETLRTLADNGLRWVSDNLGLSLAIGVGAIVDDWETIPVSCQAANAALQHKLSLGQDMVVMSEELPDKTAMQSYKYLQVFSEIVRDFRVADESWRTKLDSVFESFQKDSMKDEQIRMLLQALMQMLEREIGDLSDNIRKSFDGTSMRFYEAELEETSTLSQVREVQLNWLTELYRIYVSVNETKSYRAMISEMKVYIEENFANPDLSLKHLSDRFQISGKYASYLFKEEFDMKFIDFLMQLRVQRAEYLLAGSSSPIQDIALQVGYANSITFGRVFKRIVGVTPGDYRKLKMKPEQ
ncbi:helix-turn-helix domain-containing protein [Paenibacillus sinopodophylli]|uniref:helix-turn-helix domain-containing protein n=1 Tax=Paenibacillus sinopodophylli TaxID=1837342 RepID=UPI001FE71F4B|nr:helix-turn-helix domain-containing protein [Paenibacillus sinopodophylli]